MKLSISQKDLSKGINIVSKAVSTRTTMPILSGLLLEARDNTLYLTATDLDLGIKTSIQCNIQEEGAIVVNSRLLNDFIRKLPSNSNVNISTNENNKMDIRCEKSDFVILCNSADEYPDNSFIKEGLSISIDSTKLKKLIKYTSFAAAQDNMKPVLTGCLMELEDNKCTFAAIDGYRLAVKEEEIDFTGENKAIIPSKSLLEVYRIIEDIEGDIEIVLSDSHISFLVEDTVIMSTLLEGEFIKYKDIIKEGYVSKIKLNTGDFRNSIERVSLLAKEDKNNLVIFKLNQDNITIESTSEYGNAEEVIDIELEGEELKIGFNSKYILDLLKVVESEEIYLEFQGNLNPCIVRLVGTNHFMYLVLPVRIG
jgi:DNA polymerase-3 subunit beta